MSNYQNPSEILGQPLTLPNGVVVNNRFLKSAMSEALGSTLHESTNAHVNLYRAWANGGTGLVVTGNVMIDSRHLGEPGNVAVENEHGLEQLQRWAKAGTANGNHLWMQLNHPGKQTPGFITKEPVAPSAIPLSLPGFNQPRALTEAEINDLIERFGRSAAIAKKAGFTGVQIHGAHGYLVNQFLSSHHNQRSDQWGGSLENRMRFLLAVYSFIREQVGAGFPVSIKLNSADFQRGGFTETESLQVIQTLAEAGMDLIEISGGTYEAPAMLDGKHVKESTRQREAYFLSFAEKVRQVSQVPLAVTGGFRTAEGMAEAVGSGATDFVGLARPLVVTPDLSNQILNGEPFRSPMKARQLTGIKRMDDSFPVDNLWYEYQLHRMGQGKQPDPNTGALSAVVKTVWRAGLQNMRRRRV